MSEWTREDIQNVNNAIEDALTPGNNDWEKSAVLSFQLMRTFNLGIECLSPTNTGVPEDPAALNDGPLPKRASGEDQDNVKWGERTIPFGKYKGDTLENVLRNDRDYFRWMATKAEIISPALKEALDGLWAAHGQT